ncbi:MAG TPA: zinc-ribbon domain-containing protein [Anaeromyxobacteraceae bacterium]|nr:zinc-ribbon domain-containing protein [Anaeromyxobacteraceae bacterium]
MDVRCERCRAQYVFDDDQVTPAGLTVQCTNCGHVFRVKKKELVVTVPVKPEEMEGKQPLPATAAAPRAPGMAGDPDRAKEKEWRVRQANGNVFTFKELTTLQKWIVEQKVSRDDEISLSGDQWKRLGNIAELASFFQVVEAAEKGRAQGSPVSMAPVYGVPVQSPLYPAPFSPPAYPPSFGVPAPGQPASPFSPAVPPPPFSPPTYPQSFSPPTAPQPFSPATAPGHLEVTEPVRPVRRAGPSQDVELSEDDLRAVGKRRRPGAVAAVLLLLVAAGALAYVLKPEWAEWVGLRPKAPPAVAVPITIELKPVDPAPAGGAAPGTPGDQAAAAPVPTPEPVGEAALPKAPEPVAKPEPKPAPAAARPRGVKQLLAVAAKLREKGDAEHALDLYGRAVDEAPDNAAALAGRGLCYLDLSQYPPAEASFEAALQIDPREPDALLGLAETYRWQGKKAEAITYYERYLAQYPDGEEAAVARNAISQLKE